MIDESKYIVYFDHPYARGIHSVRYFAVPTDVRGAHVAAHEKIEAVRLAIPTTHYKAPYRQDAPVIEVWVHNSIPKP